MKKSLLALAVSLVAVSGAHAAWDTGYNPSDVSVGNGEALFMAFDDVKGVSYVLDLGVRYNDLVSGAAFNGQTRTVDFSVFAGSALSDVSWQIVVGSGDKRNGGASSTNNFSKYGFLMTVDANTAVADYNNSHTTTIVNGYLTRLDGLLQSTGNSAGTASQNDAVTESAAFGSKFAGGTAASAYGSGLSLDTFGAITGETLNVWRIGFGATSSAKQSNILGSVSLTGNTLTLGTAPTVPVPAAAWLMGSALLGLGGVARRRNKA